ncbi:GNAT family N-acetyltransferase [Thermopolyspora sp. NPDC052614]|uniref:GNAT family N-acetyltransferase n=1 Tax=Thermopolyspora sp. NPDC052614 TaxID=3155682 RepID=UPI0034337D21
MIELRRVGPEGFSRALHKVIDIYAAAMRPPADQLTGRAAIMRTHASYPGFTCLFAESAETGMVGFGYGFHGMPGQWWHDVVRRALAEHAGQEAAETWFDDAFEIAEIHIHPDHQNRGIGRRLMHVLCEGRPERTAVLSTHDQPTAARHLYHSLGFADLISGYAFPGGYEHYAIVGTTLPLPAATPNGH